MISRQIIKENAKAQLGGNIFANTWLMALLILFIEGGIITVASGIIASASAGAGTILNCLVIGPLEVGVISIFVNLLRFNKPIEIEELFSGFKNNFGRNSLLSLLMTIFTFLWTLLFIIPGIVKAYSYSMSYFIANDHPEYDWKTCINESKRLTNGHKMDLFILDLSFLGWYILGVLCFGVGVLWVAPYHKASKINYYEAIKNLDSN